MPDSDDSIEGMRAALPYILVFLAIFSAGCIAYIAWELSSDKTQEPPKDVGEDIQGDDD